MSRFNSPGPRMIELLKRAGSHDQAVARQGMHELARALETPLRKGVLKGDITSDIYEREDITPGVAAEYPLDFLAPGTEHEFTAYTIPALGRIPERHVEGDYTMVPTYDVGSSIDFALRYAEEARWPVVGRALEVLEGSFVRKKNTDGWRVLLAAGYGRFLNVYDDKVGPGFMSKRLIELMKNVIRRQSGGNSTSVNRGKLTRLYVSPESLGDIHGWDTTEVDPFTRRELFVRDDLDAIKIFGVEVRALDELGVGQEFQNYFLSTLGGVLPSYTRSAVSEQKVELVVGLDLSRDGVFMNPVKKDVELYEDPTFHRQRRASMYGWGNWGWANLDSRACLIGSL